MAKKKGISASYGLTGIRVVAGLIFLLAGWSKVSGISGFEGMLAGIGFPAAIAFAWLVAIVELVGGLALILGAFSRWASIPLAVVMVVSIVLHWVGHFGGAAFNMWRLDLLLVAALLAVYWGGPSACSLDAKLKN